MYILYQTKQGQEKERDNKKRDNEKRDKKKRGKKTIFGNIKGIDPVSFGISLVMLPHFRNCI